MKLLIVAATSFEIAPIKAFLSSCFELKEERTFIRGEHSVNLLITGVGQVATAYHLGCELTQNDYDLVINMGIAGTFRRDWSLGSIVQIISEQFAQLGAETASGQFMDIFELGLLKKDSFPFKNGKLVNSFSLPAEKIQKAAGITVDTTHGFEASIKTIEQYYQPEIESMEGAAFFYVCFSQKVKCLQLRGVSNYVEARNKNNWDIALAIQNLNQTAIGLIRGWLHL